MGAFALRSGARASRLSRAFPATTAWTPGRARHVAASAWNGVEALPSDPILGIVAAFKEDPVAQKVNVAQGAYRTDEGQPFVLTSIKEAEQRVSADLAAGNVDKEYLPIEGN